MNFVQFLFLFFFYCFFVEGYILWQELPPKNLFVQRSSVLAGSDNIYVLSSPPSP